MHKRFSMSLGISLLSTALSLTPALATTLAEAPAQVHLPPSTDGLPQTPGAPVPDPLITITKLPIELDNGCTVFKVDDLAQPQVTYLTICLTADGVHTSVALPGCVPMLPQQGQE